MDVNAALDVLPGSPGSHFLNHLVQKLDCVQGIVSFHTRAATMHVIRLNNK